MASKVRILNIDVLRITEAELLRQFKSGVLFTPNINHMVKLQHDRDFYNAYTDADWVVCDSRILYFMSKLLKHPLPEAIPGSTFFRHFCDYHRDDAECRIFIMGGKPGVAEKARANINRRIGREIVVGYGSPIISIDAENALGNSDQTDETIDSINRSGATVLAVCLGAPKQEIWIHRNRHRMPGVKLFMALGATVDFEAQTRRRAPMLMRKLGMEWLYRFVHEPRRLFKRYFIQDPRFFLYFMRHLF